MSSTETVATRSLGESELRGMLGQVERRRDGARLLLVTAEPRWDGPSVIESAIGPVRVVVGPSPLAVRIAMVDHPDDFLAILTPLTIAELGEEVAARAWRHRTHRPSPWDAVASLFKVQQVDPSLRGDRWMVDLLVRLAPTSGYPQPASQILDRETAWRTLYRHGLRLPAGELTTRALLAWAGTTEAVEAVGKLDEDARHNVAARLAVDVGPAAEPILELVSAGSVADLLPIGLALDALWPGPDPVARALLQERYLKRRPITDPAADDWGTAAIDLARQPQDAGERAALLQRAQQILAEVDAEGTADSDLLENGLHQRLALLGKALTVALDVGGAEALREVQTALTRVRAHDQSDSAPGRIAAAKAAFRLTRRHISDSEAAEGGLDQLTRAYIDDGGWVDACRHRLAEGETVPELAAAYQRLIATIDQERRDCDRAFARAVAQEGTTTPPDATLDSVRPLRIEQVLDTVVAPLAEQHPVLLLVIDGLSHPAAVPLLGDLLGAGWQLQGPKGRDLPGVIAALPTVTVCSRTSLLAGRLTAGGQDVEREGFTGHGALTDAAVGQAPRLFHKADLRVSGSEVAPEPRDAIADPDQRAVGVVVNGVDDFLASGGQVRLADGLDGVPLMRQLLDAALEAGRVVIITSDHGHILGAHQRVIAPNGGGERFRLADGNDPAEDEVELAGPRVLRGDGHIVAGADDGVRYIGVAKHGYHGGATPAEVLCPLLVLASQQTTIEGWEPIEPRVPSWWDPQLAPVDLGGEPTPASRPATSKSAEPQLSLLEPAAPAEVAPQPPTPSRPAWLDALLASPRLEDQRRLAGRATLDEQGLAQLVHVLVASGGTASGATLQRTLGVPATRLRGKLEAARTLLDVDGYAVLRIEADGTAVLNLDLLAQQFEIEAPRR